MRLAILGLGHVSRALLGMLRERKGDLYRRFGLSPRVVAVMDSRGAAVCDRGLPLETLLQCKAEGGSVADLPDHGLKGLAAEQLLADSSAEVLIEATPSRMDAPQEALAHLQTAFCHGMHAISVNKAPLAVALPALRELAAYNRVEFRFSGTVGAGTPVFQLAKASADGDEVLGVEAILNGTTNFILHQMHEQGTSYDDALAKAQQLGYAEADPTADVDGIDAATKLVIFANLVLGRTATFSDVQREGIRSVTLEQLRDAAARGMRIKLIASCEEALRVAPQEVPSDSPLNVPGSLNAVTLRLRYGGDVTLVGRGAGGPETATAIMRDLVNIWQTIGNPS